MSAMTDAPRPDDPAALHAILDAALAVAAERGWRAVTPAEVSARLDGDLKPLGGIGPFRARLLAATPRVRLPVLQAAAVELDALVGSARDPGERYRAGDLCPAPHLYVVTEAEQGGFTMPGGRFSAIERSHPPVDAYGAGDSFAAGFTAALAAGWDRSGALALACRCGAAALDARGAYASQWRAPLTGSPPDRGCRSAPAAPQG